MVSVTIILLFNMYLILINIDIVPETAHCMEVLMFDLL